MSASKHKLAHFNLEWKLKYFCREHGCDSQCVICRKHIICKQYNIKRHYDCFHAEYNNYSGEDRRNIYQRLLSSFEPFAQNATTEKIQLQLNERIPSFMALSLAIDVCTDDTETAQLAIFIRGIDQGLNVTEELLDVLSMNGTLMEEDIFQCLKKCALRMGINWNNLVSIATDGTKAMTASKTGVVARIREMIKQENFDNDIVAIHCLIRQEALCSSSNCLKNVLDVVRKCIDIVVAHDLTPHGQFHNFLELAGSEGLCRGKTLQRFFELRAEFATFLAEIFETCPELDNTDWVTDLAFLADITQHLDVLSTALMERNKIVPNMSNDIVAFKMKIALWRLQIEEHNFYFFPCLQQLSGQSINTLKYSAEMVKLDKQIDERFAELQTLKEKFEIFTSPFAADPYYSPNDLQMELIELQCDSRLKNDYKDTKCLVNFYKQLCPTKFANLRAFAANIIAMFGSTYICEQYFATNNLNKSRTQNSHSDCKAIALLSISTEIDIKPDIDDIVM